MLTAVAHIKLFSFCRVSLNTIVRVVRSERRALGCVHADLVVGSSASMDEGSITTCMYFYYINCFSFNEIFHAALSFRHNKSEYYIYKCYVSLRYPLHGNTLCVCVYSLFCVCHFVVFCLDGSAMLLMLFLSSDAFFPILIFFQRYSHRLPLPTLPRTPWFDVWDRGGNKKKITTARVAHYYTNMETKQNTKHSRAKQRSWQQKRQSA